MTRNLYEKCSGRSLTAPGLGLETGPSEFPDRYLFDKIWFLPMMLAGRGTEPSAPFHSIRPVDELT